MEKVLVYFDCLQKNLEVHINIYINIKQIQFVVWSNTEDLKKNYRNRFQEQD